MILDMVNTYVRGKQKSKKFVPFFDKHNRNISVSQDILNTLYTVSNNCYSNETFSTAHNKFSKIPPSTF